LIGCRELCLIGDDTWKMGWTDWELMRKLTGSTSFYDGFCRLDVDGGWRLVWDAGRNLGGVVMESYWHDQSFSFTQLNTSIE
jgi:hypothetical protein